MLENYIEKRTFVWILETFTQYLFNRIAEIPLQRNIFLASSVFQFVVQVFVVAARKSISWIRSSKDQKSKIKRHPSKEQAA